jgi:hypothetical protein
MLKRLVPVIAAFGLVVAACGGGTASCEDIANDAVALVQDIIDEVDTMSPDELAGLDQDPDFITDFEQKAEELDEEAAAAGCSNEELSQLVAEQSGSLTAESEFGQLFVDLINSGEFFEL